MVYDIWYTTYPITHKSCCAWQDMSTTPAFYLRPACSEHLHKVYIDSFFIRPEPSNHSAGHPRKIFVELCTLMAPFPCCLKSEMFSLLLVLHLDHLVAKLTHLQLGPLIEIFIP